MLIYAGGIVLTALISVPNCRSSIATPLKWLELSVAEEFPKEQPQKPVAALAASGKKKSAKKSVSGGMDTGGVQAHKSSVDVLRRDTWTDCDSLILLNLDRVFSHISHVLLVFPFATLD
ncbi:hypothetical protein MLD38_017041 [Melastoma candidum]|uniref:Uncharacterized protein n=1 Tax=Melastoma candidum TaxID=119954 RepID=A0ACB9QP97_9MYRT|nr:hypothetical protein MLD38_017041 [Melastoma candidum]